MELQLDSHTHLPSKNRAKVAEMPYLGYFPTRREAIAYAKRAGIAGMVFNTIEGVFADSAEELESANREALEIMEENPGYCYPGLVLQPQFPAKSLEWIKRFHDLGLVWVGELVHYRAGRGDYDKPEWFKLFKKCCDYGMVVQLHESPSIPRLAKLLPDLRIVRSHITIADLPESAAHPNVYIDISGAQGGLKFGAMEAALRCFGPDRVLFGTDFVIYQIEAFQFRAKQAYPNPDERRKICAENLKRLLGKPFFRESVSDS